jgi:hypothetical protein
MTALTEVAHLDDRSEELPGPGADVYALALVLIECLTGRREYPGPLAEPVLAAALGLTASPEPNEPDRRQPAKEKLKNGNAHGHGQG